MNFSEALNELRKRTKKRDFDQSLDLIVNLKGFDPKRESLKALVELPFPYKKKKIAAFLEKSPAKAATAVDYVITKDVIEKISAAEIKKLIKGYDSFIASAKLMPLIAKRFGKELGTAGKMPDPALGAVLAQESDEAIAASLQRLGKIIKIKAKEASIKVAIGKESMADEQLERNASAIFNAIVKALPKGAQNVRNVLLKFTMSVPIKVK